MLISDKQLERLKKLLEDMLNEQDYYAGQSRPFDATEIVDILELKKVGKYGNFSVEILSKAG